MDWNNINRDRDTSGLGPIEYDQTKVPNLIRQYADDVRTKTYGQEVREAQARNAEVAGLIASEAVDTSNETKGRQDTVETQFNSVQQELTDKDVISAPEIIAARNGEATLNNRLTKGEEDLQDRGFNGKKFGLLLDGSDETLKLQEFVDYCYDNNLKAILAGKTTISAKVSIMCDFDFSMLEVTQLHNGVGLMIGKDTSNAKENGYGALPKMTKTGAWDSSVGVMLKNLNRWTIHIPKIIRGFGVGLQLTAENYGTAYNNIHWNSIMNNKINIEILATKTGWVNENSFFGGSASHTTEHGMALADVHNLKIHLTADSPFIPDGNTFYSPSFEGSVPDIPIYIQGNQNTIYNGRYEAHEGRIYKILFTGDATRQSVANSLVFGYGLGNVEVIQQSYASGNIRLTPSTLEAVTRSSKSALKLKSLFSSENKVVEIGGPHSDENIVITPDYLDMKMQGDKEPRFRLRNNGQMSFGNGTDKIVNKITNSNAGISFNDGIHTVNSSWDKNVLRLGNYYIWVASDGYLRMKAGKPTHDLDGNPVTKP